MNADLLNRASVWTRYWARGSMHSCMGSYDERYAGPIADFWRGSFQKLKTGARVLDIGTGNGPLPRLLLDLESRQDLGCDAIDLAEIEPPWLVQLPQSDRERVRFHSGCRAEQLPFPNKVFDLVVSQWGLEYTNLELSLPEVLRVLAPGGTVLVLLHHTEALPVSLAVEEIEHLNWLLLNGGFLDSSEAMLGPMALAGTDEGRAKLVRDENANHARDRFNSWQDELERRVSQGQCVDVLQEVRHLVVNLFGTAAQRGHPQATALFGDLKTSILDSLARLIELRNHALDEAGARKVAERLAAGATYELGVIRDRLHVVAWALTVTPRFD